MDAEMIRDYALAKPGTEESFPFGENTLVFKVKGKIFLLVALDTVPLRCNLKADPDKAIQQREDHPEHILPGFHMNKKHWNTIIPSGLKRADVKSLIDDSFNLVAKIKS